MTRVFDRYAKYYDILYSDKDYNKECDFIENALLKFSGKKPKKILDIGCGTGNHMTVLLSRGYDVTGIDPSASMAELAEKKVRNLGFNNRVLVSKMSDFQVDKPFDAAICMFAALNYVTDTEDLVRSLANTRKHLKKEALFLFDFWYGPAVLKINPSTRIKIIESNKTKVIRTVTPEMDTFRSLIKTHYYLVALSGDKVLDELTETHELRYFFPNELDHFAKDSGLEILNYCEFPILESKPAENTWNVAAIAKAV
jgi:SAM-dependent methyltransferase